MSMNFSTIQGVTIPEGVVTQIADTFGNILWTSSVRLDEDLVLSLIDFKYTDNKDGTVTLTAWKGTLNGVASTELVIPNDTRIIL